MWGFHIIYPLSSEVLRTLKKTDFFVIIVSLTRENCLGDSSYKGQVPAIHK